MSIKDRLKEDLNGHQFVAATTDSANTLVLAGAGTGKTRTIIARAEFLIAEKLKRGQI